MKRVNDFTNTKKCKVLTFFKMTIPTLLVIILSVTALSAATFTSKDEGDWGDASIWDITDGTPESNIPGTNDHVIISVNDAITIPGNLEAYAKSLTFDTAGAKNRGSSGLIVYGSLNVSGAIENKTFPINRTYTIYIEIYDNGSLKAGSITQESNSSGKIELIIESGSVTVDYFKQISSDDGRNEITVQVGGSLTAGHIEQDSVEGGTNEISVKGTFTLRSCPFVTASGNNNERRVYDTSTFVFECDGDQKIIPFGTISNAPGHGGGGGDYTAFENLKLLAIGSGTKILIEDITVNGTLTIGEGVTLNCSHEEGGEVIDHLIEGTGIIVNNGTIESALPIALDITHKPGSAISYTNAVAIPQGNYLTLELGENVEEEYTIAEGEIGGIDIATKLIIPAGTTLSCEDKTISGVGSVENHGTIATEQYITTTVTVPLASFENETGSAISYRAGVDPSDFSYQNLILDGENGVFTLSGNLTLAENLEIRQGSLILGENTMYSPSINVVGDATLTLFAVTDNPADYGDGSQSIGRKWTIDGSGIIDGTFRWAEDLDNLSEGKSEVDDQCSLWRYDGMKWVKIAGPVSLGIANGIREINFAGIDLTAPDNGGTRGDNIGDITVTNDTKNQTLPVELSSFTAIAISGMSVKLEWTAETETNLLGYNIYRSKTNQIADAVKVNFIVIPAYNTSTTRRYTYTDETIEFSQLYYYWLQSNDLDLSHEFHGPVSVLVEDLDGESTKIELPIVTGLQGAYPNPFNPGTYIAFSIEEKTDVSLSIYNIKGQFVRRLLDNEEYQKGRKHSVYWDGTDYQGNRVGSGVYMYIMKAGADYQEAKKMIMMK